MTNQEKTKRSYFTKFKNGYRFTALMLLNTLIGLFILNVCFFYYFKKIDSTAPNIISQRYYDINIASIYNMNYKEMNDLLKETWSRNYMYEPFAQFKERPYKGEYVNIDNNGFRHTKNQGPWPPKSESINIFLFGGSTTFGYGVSDNQTVASYLQEYLSENLGRDVRVYNFGRGYYYSTQELFLYLQLLKSGFVPDFAIFIDGLNDFGIYQNDEPHFSNRLRKLFDPETGEMTKKLISMTSLVRGAEMVRNMIAYRLPKKNLEQKNDPEKEINDNKIYNNPVVLDKIINRYLMNKKLIEAASNIFGVQPVFVWQPIPTYHFDLSYHPFLKGNFEGMNYQSYGYSRMAGLIKEKPMGSNFIWCADIQKEFKKPLYIDMVHYSPSFSKLFAEVIANQLVEKFNLKKN